MSPSDSGDPARIPGREGLLAIRKRADEATPGPWAWEATGEKSNDYAIGQAYAPDGTPISGRFTSSDDPDSGVWMEDAIVRRHLVGEGENGRFADAEFIAHAREDIPFLLQRIDELEAALSAPPEPSADLVRELADFGEKLAAAQEDLPQDMARVLHDNLWELYDAIPVKAEAVPAPQQELQSAIDGALRELDIAASYDGAAEVSVGLRIHARACRLAAKNLRTAVSAALADDRRSAPRREVLAEFRQRIAAQPHYAPCPHNWAQPDRSQHCLCWMAPALDFLDAELSLGSAAGGHAPQPAPRREIEEKDH